MNTVFHAEMVVHAPADAVAAFHASTKALRWLTPPPVWVQFHHLDPLGEGAVAEFTMWFLFFPIRWRAVHHQVSNTGFVDEQEAGPLKFWQHVHRFETISDQQTKISDTVSFSHHAGSRGVLSRLFFNRFSLQFLFKYRHWVTRRRLFRQ